MITHHDSLGIPIIHTNIPRSDPSKYFSVSSQSYFVCTRRLSGPPLIHLLWKQLETIMHRLSPTPQGYHGRGPSE
jgi:hypothetical protein